MKKIISLIIAVLLLVSVSGFTACAIHTEDASIEYEDCNLPVDEKITFSDDFKNLYVGKQSYSRVNLNDAYLSIDHEVPNSRIIDNDLVEEVELLANESGNVIDATIYYKDGAVLYVTFLDDRYQNEVQEILDGKNKELFIDFYLNDKSLYSVDTNKLKGKQITLKTEDFYYESETFGVSALVLDKSIDIFKGNIHILNDKVYFEENGANKDTYATDGAEWNLYEVEDKALIKELIAKQEQYYKESGYGLFMDDEILKIISIVFFVIFFILLPLAIMIVAIIFTIRSKTLIYKKIYITASILAGIQTIIFIVGFMILFK